jgi:phage tail sheath protein FI
MVALLTLPLFARSEASLALAARLQATVDPDTSIPVPALGVGEARAWSYTALYHPWVQTVSPDGDVTPTPPDGALAGLYARLALDRDAGAWIAPANAALVDPLALTPIIERSRWLDLLVRQINVIRAEPTGVICLSADTLSSDDDLRPVNVRRLLILLRRLALQLGNTYVFEANSDAFRRLVQHAFEGALLQLFQRGAFAGDTAAEAFRVNTGTTINTPTSVDAGRLIVEIQVAPSRPMAFITLRLIQTNERSSVSEIS